MPNTAGGTPALPLAQPELPLAQPALPLAQPELPLAQPAYPHAQRGRRSEATTPRVELMEGAGSSVRQAQGIVTLAWRKPRLGKPAEP